MDIKTKAFSGQLIIKDEARGIVEAEVATVGAVDLDGDVLLAGSTPAGAKVKLSSYAHDVVRVGAPPVGSGTLHEQGGKVVLRASYYMAIQRAREAFYTVRELAEDGQWSLGFPQSSVVVAPMTDDYRAKGARRLIARYTPVEASPVFRAASPGTRTLSTKSAPTPAPSPLDTMTETEIAALLKSNMQSFQDQYGPLDSAPPPDRDTHLLATELAAWAAARCGARAPVVKWFRPDDSPAALGWFLLRDPDAIYVRTDGVGADLVETVFHEVAHYARHARGMPNDEVVVKADTDVLLDYWTLERSDPWHVPTRRRRIA